VQGGDALQHGRTDDLLTSGSESEGRQGFTPAEEAGELQTGLGGMGSLSTGNAGNRQSEGETQPGGQSDAMRPGADSGNARASGGGGLPRQGVVPGEELGHLHGRKTGG